MEAYRRPRPQRVLAIALLLAAIPALVLTVGYMASGASPVSAFLVEGLPLFVWAFLTPLIFGLAQRFPVDRPPRGRAWLVHVAAGLAAGLLLGCLTALLGQFVELPAERRGESPSPLTAILVWIPGGLIMYGAIASIGFAVDYLARMREREQAAVQLKRMLVESRLGALRMQLQPHFLFNALNTVAMLVREGSGPEAVRVIARLAELLRQVLDEEAEQEVALGRELDLVGRYLEIEQARFGDRLRVEVEADARARAVAVPHLLLQPIVENAVRHGISRRADASRIDIRARRENGRLTIEVTDDGPGLPAGWSLEGADGIGLRNTRERLLYLYGGDAELRLTAADGGGVRAEVELPAKDAKP